MKNELFDSNPSVEVIDDAYEKLVQKFIDWAEKEENIRAAAVIGSRARVDHPADQWSDMDVIVVARYPNFLLSSADWIYQIGNPWLTFVDKTGDGSGYERRVLFEDGLDVDFAPVSVDLYFEMVSAGLPEVWADVIQRGVRVLIDKDGYLADLLNQEIKNRPMTLPSEQLFLNVVNDFWYHTVWTGKHLRRGELWWAKGGCDAHIKGLLRQMLEWHAQAIGEREVDTWMRGRFLEEWADPRAVESLPEVFAHYDEDDIWRALMATSELFRWLAEETAVSLKFDYPVDSDKYATELVLALYGGRRER